jgi:predicted AlkP superfamily phosphohydrolase/phosphomutase
VRFGGIDWPATQAFSEELNYFPSIWLNVAGRDEHGSVPLARYQATCDAITARLLAWRDPVHGTPVVRRVWQRDALYHGPCVATAPDLVLDLETPGGYSYVGLPSFGEAGAPIERLGAAGPGGGKLAGMSGSHRSDGLFMLSGAAVRPGPVAGAQIADMAATILRLNGLSAPADWDGRPLGCVDGGAAAEAAGDAADECPSAERPYGPADEADLERRLAALGYLA